MGFLPWETWFAFPGESQLWQSRATQATVHVQVFQCFHNPPNSNMDYRIFNVRTGVNTYDCTQGCTDTRKRVCTESWLWKKNPLLHLGIEPASVAWWSDALTDWATSPTPTTRGGSWSRMNLHGNLKGKVPDRAYNILKEAKSWWSFMRDSARPPFLSFGNQNCSDSRVPSS